jgi:hypothetical protein
MEFDQQREVTCTTVSGHMRSSVMEPAQQVQSIFTETSGHLRI